ncbi:FAD-binding oxidoreductase [Myxococcota bacterium]|nr:FAD-binding oxidoreductase [Myxococcota bacterium]
MLTPPLWLDPLPQPRPALRGPLSVDVVVLGAGLCGASAAYHLTREGLRVAVVESRASAMAASGRNAGFILQGTAERYSRARSLMGHDRARRVHAWSVENHTRLAAAIQELQLDCEYQRRGSLQIGAGAEEQAELRESARMMVEDGFDAELREGEALHERYRRRGNDVALFLPGDGEVHPARLVRGLLDAAERAGALIFEGCPATALDAAQAGDVRVSTPEGEITAEAAVVALNARVGDLLPFFRDKVDPVRGQMLATAPLPQIFECPIYANHGYDYWRQDPAGRIVLGGWRNLDPQAEVGHDETLHDQIQARMTQFVESWVPGEQVQVTHRWSGIMGFSRDGLPMVGPAPGTPGAVVGAGFTGHGFGFGFLAGAALTRLILDGQHPFCDDLSPHRFR